ncbi:hypothetical protein J2Z21_004064 [Streptomyces griseochromogenes]|uniref:Uncharacterized protein n=1 Tax=Streptomyces griseochromogenes TaxID=68214 RepID=A0A1B1BB26_9ACTN|nr:DUF6274 family protein [Streptomyces griseochromogenes]ANP56035.1 hypothetical protein AVL59_46255 [Streptomyces griseochromogenes]MBP2051114.1 hypothetical protein [Streptomyces griseochromogenes]
MTASARHETRALLRAHLAAASSYRHLTRHCPICHHLLRLAMATGPRPPEPGGEVVEVIDVVEVMDVVQSAEVVEVIESEASRSA